MITHWKLLVGLWQCGLVVTLATSAWADTGAQPQSVEQASTTVSEQLPPWTRGVTKADQERARTLSDEAHRLNAQLRFEEAAEQYERALEYWDHPEIRLAASRAWKNALRLLKAYQHLEKALYWGDAPWRDYPGEYESVQRDLALLRKRIIEVEVRCQEVGATVRLNGSRWFRCPGSERRALVVGEHEISIEKAGYHTVRKPLSLRPGQAGVIEVSELSPREVIRSRWPRALPWAAIVTGAMLGVSGGALKWDASHRAARYRANLVADCTPFCSDAPAGLERIERRDRIAAAGLIVGGVVLTTGLVLAWLNQPQPVPNHFSDHSTLQVTPLIDSQAAGVMVEFGF